MNAKSVSNIQFKDFILSDRLNLEDSLFRVDPE